VSHARAAARRALAQAAQWGLVLAALVPASVSLGVSRARAQHIATLGPAPCTDEGSIRAHLEALGVSEAGDARITLALSTSWAGLVRGDLHVEQRGRGLERTLEDEACEDVVAALAIAAALALRGGLGEGAPRATAPDVLPLEVIGRDADRPAATAPRVLTPRIALGAEARIGQGPVPGWSIAPGLVLALALDALWLAARVSHWPASTASGDGTRAVGASLFALGAGLEIGARTEGDIGVLLAGVLETGFTLSRGVGVQRPEDVAAGLFDLGAAVTMEGRAGPFSLFVRVDLLACVVRPAYLVGEHVAFEGPALRGA
jgi:hypothetical protein